MIRYALRCEQDHDFESWFKSADAFERLQAAGHVACTICGTHAVEKALMAPALGRAEEQAGPAGPLSAPASPAEQALRALREKIERESDYVGERFVHEARAIHAGEAPERPIWGEARPAEARALIEEGVPVAPLPFAPARKRN